MRVGMKMGLMQYSAFDKEFLAYSPRVEKGEVDFPNLYAEPNEKVIQILENSKNLNEALENVFNTNWP